MSFIHSSATENGWMARWLTFSWNTARWCSPPIRMKACGGGSERPASHASASARVLNEPALLTAMLAREDNREVLH